FVLVLVAQAHLGGLHLLAGFGHVRRLLAFALGLAFLGRLRRLLFLRRRGFLVVFVFFVSHVPIPFLSFLCVLRVLCGEVVFTFRIPVRVPSPQSSTAKPGSGVS